VGFATFSVGESELRAMGDGGRVRKRASAVKEHPQNGQTRGYGDCSGPNFKEPPVPDRSITDGEGP
jgi:hypothetical protein